MDLLKNHYEKIILSVVLLGLAVAAAYLPIEVSKVQQSLDQTTQEVDRLPVKPLEPMDLSTNELAVARVEKPMPVPFASQGHNVFNPGRWVRTQDGGMAPEEDFGIDQLAATRIVPLYTRIEFLGVRSSEVSVRYQIQVTREASEKASDQRPKLRFMTPGERDSSKDTLFVFREVQGPPEAPTGVVIELVEEGRSVTISEDKPFEEVDGYAADLRHLTTNRNYTDQRVDSRLALSGETYIIVAIGPADVTLENVHSHKRTTIHLDAAP